MSEPPHYPGVSSPSTNFFPYASNTIVNGGTFIGSCGSMLHDDSFKHLKPLYKLVAQNAILNQGGRADEVRCYPGTREVVIAKIETWRNGGYLVDRLIFWLSGPAGAGKSAIVQTVAERCIKDGVPMINFFFFRADSTRNYARPVVPTLVFQLLKIFPSLKAHITMIIRENPIIFNASLATQLRTLIIDPILYVRRTSPSPQPILLLIDGLDECESKADQSALLRILHELVNLQDSPFIVLVSSRTESQIIMAFKSLQTFHRSIFLDNSYRPKDDIRLYVRAELAQIKRTHPVGNTLASEWPFEDHIAAIVRKSSGQFVYASTVVRFVSDPSMSPNASMQTVLGLRSAGNRTPFAEIDALYTHVLSQIDDWDMVRDVIVMNKVMWGTLLNDTVEIFGHKLEDITSTVMNLAPILRLGDIHAGTCAKYIHFYHSSFNDFLYSTTRAGNFYIDVEAVVTHMLHSLLVAGPQCHLSEMPSTWIRDHLPLLTVLLTALTKPTVELTTTLQRMIPTKGIPCFFETIVDANWFCRAILRCIESLYMDSEWDNTGAEIIRNWFAWFKQKGLPEIEYFSEPDHWIAMASEVIKATAETSSKRPIPLAKLPSTPTRTVPTSLQEHHRSKSPTARRILPVNNTLPGSRPRRSKTGTNALKATPAAPATPPATSGAQLRSHIVPTARTARRTASSTFSNPRPGAPSTASASTVTSVKKDKKPVARARQPPPWRF